MNYQNIEQKLISSFLIFTHFITDQHQFADQCTTGCKC